MRPGKAFEFVPLAALRFERLRHGDAGRLSPAFPAGAPLELYCDAAKQFWTDSHRPCKFIL
jgi:hypothetical protein